MKTQELIAVYERISNFAETVEIKSVIEKLKRLEEPETQVPQFVADWIEKAKFYEWDLDDVFDHIAEEPGDSEISIWFYTLGNVDVFARAWLDGYTVEEEKWYYVRLKNVDENYNYLTCIKHLNAWALTEIKRDKKFRTEHTRKQLEDADFGWVFDCPGSEIEEVEE